MTVLHCWPPALLHIISLPSSRPPPSLQPPVGLLHDLADQLQQHMDQLTPGQQALLLQVCVCVGGGGGGRGRVVAAWRGGEGRLKGTVEI